MWKGEYVISNGGVAEERNLLIKIKSLLSPESKRYLSSFIDFSLPLSLSRQNPFEMTKFEVTARSD